MAALGAGTVLGDRFEIVGELGRGGTATVYLARDRLRGERLALKVLHPHLAHDPTMRERLRREVQAAAVLRHPSALVAHDLHELDGLLALSLPYHSGETLTERVASGGALPVPQVRTLGIQLAGALAEAHRSGLLHRDVTPNNVLIGPDGGAVLTDFGLARIAEPGGSRSTGVLGTAGYAAPEVYAGNRRDPRSDLYGLGALLYLAATGRPPYEAPTPMAALQRQLAGAHAPVAELRPELPPALAELIERLLAQDPDRRLQGAREVLDVLEFGELPEAPPAAGPRPRKHLEPGNFTVHVEENSRDFSRRSSRRTHRDRRNPPAEVVRRLAKQFLPGLLETLGLNQGLPPEEALVVEVARAAGLPPEALEMAPELLERHFRLVDGVDRATAQRLCRKAVELGFKARVDEVPKPPGQLQALWPTLLGAGWTLVAAAALIDLPVAGLVFVMIVVTVLGTTLHEQSAQRQRVRKAPVAYHADLTGHLADDYAHLGLAAGEAADPAPVVEATPSSLGQRLAERARRNLDQLEQALGSQASELPSPAVADLRRTLRDLRIRAEDLASDIDRLQGALPEGPPDDASWLHARIARLTTRKRAGEPVDEAELARLQAALEAEQADRAAADLLESQLTACKAQLLEIASAASRVRRELLAGGRTAGADGLVARLQQQTRAADAARREAGRRAAAAAQRQT